MLTKVTVVCVCSELRLLRSPTFEFGQPQFNCFCPQGDCERGWRFIQAIQIRVEGREDHDKLRRNNYEKQLQIQRRLLRSSGAAASE